MSFSGKSDPRPNPPSCGHSVSVLHRRRLDTGALRCRRHDPFSHIITVINEENTMYPVTHMSRICLSFGKSGKPNQWWNCPNAPKPQAVIPKAIFLLSLIHISEPTRPY
eukprot:TRINITY_DN15914_c0_g1_i2.p2 TRINITY_DN15914_c0_g1~~TRINITY_DN15914_c0_g1_i2.p2  ORF type:complete len:109 (+),score=9.64 TRINITY_DN15914_c0_g1_i2:529-855(+)